MRRLLSPTAILYSLCRAPERCFGLATQRISCAGRPLVGPPRFATTARPLFIPHFKLHVRFRSWRNRDLLGLFHRCRVVLANDAAHIRIAVASHHLAIWKPAVHAIVPLWDSGERKAPLRVGQREIGMLRDEEMGVVPVFARAAVQLDQ